MTRTEAMWGLFKQFPGEWISALELARQFGFLCWRTEVSRVRKQFHATVENKVIRSEAGTRSFYRYVPGENAHV